MAKLKTDKEKHDAAKPSKQTGKHKSKSKNTITKMKLSHKNRDRD
jgi:hypothetical protein